MKPVWHLAAHAFAETPVFLKIQGYDIPPAFSKIGLPEWLFPILDGRMQLWFSNVEVACDAPNQIPHHQKIPKATLRPTNVSTTAMVLGNANLVESPPNAAPVEVQCRENHEVDAPVKKEGKAKPRNPDQGTNGLYLEPARKCSPRNEP
jgi:hypothetical protein